MQHGLLCTVFELRVNELPNSGETVSWFSNSLIYFPFVSLHIYLFSSLVLYLWSADFLHLIRVFSVLEIAEIVKYCMYTKLFVCLFLRSVSVVAPFPEDWFSDGIVYPKLAWLGNELLSKLAKWSVEQKPSEFKSTLSLVSVAKYSKVYQDLKEKYKEMVKVSLAVNAVILSFHFCLLCVMKLLLSITSFF